MGSNPRPFVTAHVQQITLTGVSMLYALVPNTHTKVPTRGALIVVAVILARSARERLVCLKMSTLLSCQDMRQQESLQSPSLRSGFSYLYRQSLVGSESPVHLEFENSCFPKLFGTNVLLLIDTEDADEVNVLEEKVKTALEGNRSFILSHAPCVQIKQVYNEQGTKVLAERIQAMVEFVDQNRELIQTRDIGTIVMGAIQGYVRTSTRDSSGAAFEMVTLYNATTDEMIQGVSKGVPLQAEYLREAREGKTTYGEALTPFFYKAARKRFGCDFNIVNDWCWIVCGQSRHDRLQAVARDLGSILA